MSNLYFTTDFAEQPILAQRALKKASSFNNKVVITNGFNASGKTLLAPIIAAMERAELMSFAYEVEWCSSFLYSGQLDQDAYAEFVKLFVDHAIYNQLMGRSVNCRPSDLSSIFNSTNPFQYIRRMFAQGDNAIPPIIREQQPILGLVTCHLMPFVPNLAKALGDRMVFIEVVRDPIYMFRQLLILLETVTGPALEKDFTLRSFNGALSGTYLDLFSSDEVFKEIESGDSQRITVSYMERMFEFYFALDFKNVQLSSSTLILLPFEKFVLEPKPWMDEILALSGSRWSRSLDKEMKKQKVPRTLLRVGRDLPVYRRFGWSEDETGASTLEEENTNYRAQIKSHINDQDLYQRMEKLSDRYYEWIDSFDSSFIFSN